jgi:Xaa-Pro dipeptidase
MPTVELDNTFLSRQAQLARLLQKAGLDALALNPGSSLTYLTGLSFHLMERPVVAIFTRQAAPVLVLPGLEIAKTKTLPFLIQAFPYSDDPATWALAFQQAAQFLEIETAHIGVEPTRLRFLELRFLESAAPRASFISAQDTLAALRIHKDASEIGAMRKAVDIAQRALQATLPIIKIGITEAELASELTLQLLKAGSQPEMPFSPIVASGPNSANPHAVPTSRPLGRGDQLIIDWGASCQGYISDLTRTFAMGEADEEFLRIGKIVLEANRAGYAVARPGLPMGEVDRAARGVIESAGYGEYFIHRTGHGIGMEGHEEPYIYGANTQPLETGMAFTIEPGIYLPGRGGVRIEDNVVVTQDGIDCLSDLPRELMILPD